MFSWLTTAAAPYLTYIKIAAGVAVVLVIGGLWFWGHEENITIVNLNQQLGQSSQVIADQNKNINTLEANIAQWQAALKAFQQEAAAQAAATNSAVAQEEKLNAQVAHLTAQLSANPQLGLQQLNAANSQLVCMLNYATGNQQHCGPAAAAASGPAKAPGA